MLLVPGWGGSELSWGYLLPFLADRYRCVIVDHRSVPASAGARHLFGIGTMADDTMAVLDELGIATTHLIGNSLGGMIAQAAARRHPERIRSLVLLSTSPGLLGVPCSPTLLADGLQLLGGRIRGAVRRRKLHLGPANSDRAVEASHHPSVGRQFLATLSWWGLPELHRIRTPTLVVHGSEDRVIPPVNARLMARSIPGARLELIEGAGHLIIDEAFARVGDVIREFLDGSRRPALRGTPMRVTPAGV